MIRSFGCPYTKVVFDAGSPRRFPPDIIRAAYRKLVALANANDIADMGVPPANRLEKLNKPKDRENTPAPGGAGARGPAQ